MGISDFSFPIPLQTINPIDILFLLVLGVTFEFISHVASKIYSHNGRSTSSLRGGSEQQLRQELFRLKIVTAQSKERGPGAFVETSKLERAVLSKSREIKVLREHKTTRAAKAVLITTKARRAVWCGVFLCYYSIPIITTFEYTIGDDDGTSASSWNHWKSMMFPMSFLSLGLRISSIGLNGGVGALLAFWSGGTLMEKVLACF
mmetsp:Transcript_32425/g.37536  ORF Transcript_32425/g.37536 Transcript_32425/m.37536 type:complete len:204 (-) Transcript_32425:100-711(-)